MYVAIMAASQTPRNRRDVHPVHKPNCIQPHWVLGCNPSNTDSNSVIALDVSQASRRAIEEAQDMP